MYLEYSRCCLVIGVSALLPRRRAERVPSDVHTASGDMSGTRARSDNAASVSETTTDSEAEDREDVFRPAGTRCRSINRCVNYPATAL